MGFFKGRAKNHLYLFFLFDNIYMNRIDTFSWQLRDLKDFVGERKKWKMGSTIKK
jgi:hypothetical protein